ncbi:MAG: MBL fold metallo-hydrolase [candidate division Zixibacteria bacterium]|nr:MBL fold metallo-hydrolase [candidate division Zixibacteria bacterium]
MKLGDIEIISIVENRFKLDAGAMFGVIPKVIWSRMVTADDYNRIPLDINPLIVKTDSETLLVDSGFGDILSAKFEKIFGLENPTQLDSELKKNNIAPEAITGVIFTHMHADHALGALKHSPDGELQLRFPKAKYYVQRREWQDAMNPNERTAATYLVNKLRLFEESGRLELLDGDTELFPHITIKLIGGHTPGMQGVIIDGDGQHIIYPSDILPLRYNIKIPYVSAVDLDPTATINQKRWLHEKMLKEDWILAFDHDIEFKFARLKADEKGKITLEKVDG